jgi:electron-transferring-flavoprotein dehydrogenase
MEWFYILLVAVPAIVLLNVAALFVGDRGIDKRRKVKLVRPPDYNEEAKDDGVEREEMPVDVLFVGAGPAGLAGAYHLMQLVKKHNAEVEESGKGKKLNEEIQIAVLEKCSEVGAMGISGMVLDPRSLKELMPDFADRGAPLECTVDTESMHILLNDKFGAKAPFMPPPVADHGLYAGSLSKLVRWLAGICEEEGIMIFPGFAGAFPIYDDEGKVIGVRTGDKGIGHDGEKRGNFEPGIDLKAPITVLTEGARGSLTRDVVRKFKLDEGKNPQQYALGVKEIIEVPEGQTKPGEVMLTAGWPVPDDTFGGAFLYTLPGNLVTVGLVVGLDCPDPNMDPQVELQRMKTHPAYQRFLKGGKVIQYGAKTIPEGGWWSMPRPYGPGVLLAGDSGGFLNGERLKGVHLAIKTGMLAAETAFEAMLEENYSEEFLARYEKKFKESWAGEEMWRARNFHVNFHDGFWMGLAKNGLSMLTKGGGKGKPHVPADFETYRTLSEVGGERDTKKGIPYDGKLFLNKLEDVYLAGSKGAEDQPSHLQVLDKSVCADECATLYGNPCTKACPANVYEMVDDEQNPGKKKLHLNPTNCVHCKTCDLIDPYINIRWVVPEGGDGPNYSLM